MRCCHDAGAARMLRLERIFAVLRCIAMLFRLAKLKRLFIFTSAARYFADRICTLSAAARGDFIRDASLFRLIISQRLLAYLNYDGSRRWRYSADICAWIKAEYYEGGSIFACIYESRLYDDEYIEFAFAATCSSTGSRRYRHSARRTKWSSS